MPEGSVAVVDQVADLGRPARIEEHVALADRRLLGEQAGLEQRLPHLLGQRPFVAGEPARQVREVGVVAAPLAHAVEALEDPAGDAPGRIGVLVRPDACARRARAGRAPRPRAPRPTRVLGAAAEPRDRLGDAQRVVAPIGSRSSGRLEQPGRDRHGAGAQPVDARRRARRRRAARAPRGRPGPS